jgi:hypothetical protein
MARSSGTDWSLDNAESLHQRHPRTFFIPTAERRHALRRDDMVRLIFLLRGSAPNGPAGERMWLTDIRSQDDGRYVGILTNTPTAIHDLAEGDEVEFGPEHVIAVEDPDAIPHALVAFAARRLVDDDNLNPGYVFHAPADMNHAPRRDGRRASGWCLLVGDETDEQVNDPNYILLPSLAWLAERYPDFGTLIRSAPPGREYEWNLDQRRYVDIGPYVEAEG